MILKKLKRTNFRKTKAAMIGELVDYILAEKDEEENQKLLYAHALNFLTDQPESWKWEMISLAEESAQSKMPVAHWVMSWPEDELPSREQVIEATRIFLERMGLAEHQTIIAAHQNTGNFHVHIAVNRTHPVTMKVIQPHRDLTSMPPTGLSLKFPKSRVGQQILMPVTGPTNRAMWRPSSAITNLFGQPMKRRKWNPPRAKNPPSA